MDHSAVVFLLNDAGPVVGYLHPAFRGRRRFAQDLRARAPYLQSEPTGMKAAAPDSATALLRALQYLLPQHLLTRIVHARDPQPLRRWLKNPLIRRPSETLPPQHERCAQPDALLYPSFNAFFTRALRAGARPADPDPARWSPRSTAP